MGKELLAGKVVIVFGTSSAGKGTIIKEVKKQAIKSDHQKVEWQEYGVDLGMKRMQELIAEHQDAILSETVQSEEFTAIKRESGLEEKEVLDIIVRNERFAGDTGLLERLNKLKKKFRRKAGDIAQITVESLVRNIFEYTVEQVRLGESVVLDLVPSPDGSNVINNFFDYLAEQKLVFPCFVCIAHCDLPKISEHMATRNARGEPEEERKGLFPFKQYTAMYKSVYGDIEEHVGAVTVREILDVASKHGRDFKADFYELTRGLGIELSEEFKGKLDDIGLKVLEETVLQTELDRVIKINIRDDIRVDTIYQTDLLC